MSKVVTHYICPANTNSTFPTTSLPMSKNDSKIMQAVLASKCMYTISVHLMHFGKKYFPQHTAQHFGVSTMSHTQLAQCTITKKVNSTCSSPVLQ